MRTETYTRNIYTLDEVKDKAIEVNWDINVDYDWWQWVCEDAAEIGLDINEFDIDRNNHCTGELLASCREVADRIIANHGSLCDTYRLAKNFLAEAEPLIIWLHRVEESRYDIYHRGGVADTYCEKEDKLAKLERKFKRDLLMEYAVIIKKDYEYLTRPEAIEATLRTNEYEFNEDGTIA